MTLKRISTSRGVRWVEDTPLVETPKPKPKKKTYKEDAHVNKAKAKEKWEPTGEASEEDEGC